MAHHFVETATHDLGILEYNMKEKEILIPGGAKLIMSLFGGFFSSTQFLLSELIEHVMSSG